MDRDTPIAGTGSPRVPIETIDGTKQIRNRSSVRFHYVMNTKSLVVFAAVTALFTLPIQSLLAADAGSVDANFVKKVADANMTEIQLAKIALDKSQKQNVKDFANRMIKDHGNAQDQLKSIAEKMNVPIPDHVSAQHQQTIDRLSKLNGEAFDKAYAKAMVDDHTKVVAMFERNESKLQDSDLKKFAQDTLPVLKEHLELAKKL
jgi:putative membrane protein